MSSSVEAVTEVMTAHFLGNTAQRTVQQSWTRSSSKKWHCTAVKTQNVSDYMYTSMSVVFPTPTSPLMSTGCWLDNSTWVQ